MIVCSFNRGADKVHVVEIIETQTKPNPESLQNPQKLRKATKAKKPQKPRSLKTIPKGEEIKSPQARKAAKSYKVQETRLKKETKKNVYPQMLDIA